MKSCFKAGLVVGCVQLLINLASVLLPSYICCTRCSIPVLVCILGGATAGRLAVLWASDTPKQPTADGATAGALSAVGGLIGLLLSFVISLVLEGTAGLGAEEVLVLVVGIIVLSVLFVGGGAAAGKYASKTEIRTTLPESTDPSDHTTQSLPKGSEEEKEGTRRTPARYIMVFAGSVLALASISTDFYGSLIAATGDVGGPLVPVLIPGANLVSSMVIVLVSLPILIRLEKLLRQMSPKWQRWLLSLLVAGAPFVIITVVLHLGWAPFFEATESGSSPGIIEIGPIPVSEGFYLCGGIPFVVGVPLCWFLLRISDRLLGAESSGGARDASSSP
jgi:hypothetical protein